MTHRDSAGPDGASSSLAWTLTLDRGWTFRAAGEAPIPAPDEWRGATVPGHVHTDLLHHGLIPDPYGGAAEAGLQWIGVTGWSYRCQFEVPAAALEHQRMELVFDGLDTCAEVTLNGHVLLSADNAFRQWRLEPGAALRAGRNELIVQFASPIVRYAPQAGAYAPPLPGNYPSPYGDESRDAMTANFARKPGYHYGWDWGPRYVTCGIWRPVRLEAWSEVRLNDVHLQTHELRAERARLTARVECESAAAAHMTRTLVLRDPSGAIAWQRKDLVDLAGANTWIVPFDLANPRPWYPAGYGDASLYTLHAELRTVEVRMRSWNAVLACAPCRCAGTKTSADNRLPSWSMEWNGLFSSDSLRFWRSRMRNHAPY